MSKVTMFAKTQEQGTTFTRPAVSNSESRESQHPCSEVYKKTIEKEVNKLNSRLQLLKEAYDSEKTQNNDDCQNDFNDKIKSNPSVLFQDSNRNKYLSTNKPLRAEPSQKCIPLKPCLKTTSNVFQNRNLKKNNSIVSNYNLVLQREPFKIEQDKKDISKIPHSGNQRRKTDFFQTKGMLQRECSENKQDYSNLNIRQKSSVTFRKGTFENDQVEILNDNDPTKIFQNAISDLRKIKSTCSKNIMPNNTVESEPNYKKPCIKPNGSIYQNNFSGMKQNQMVYGVGYYSRDPSNVSEREYANYQNPKGYVKKPCVKFSKTQNEPTRIGPSPRYNNVKCPKPNLPFRIQSPGIKQYQKSLNKTPTLRQDTKAYPRQPRLKKYAMSFGKKQTKRELSGNEWDGQQCETSDSRFQQDSTNEYGNIKRPSSRRVASESPQRELSESEEQYECFERDRSVHRESSRLEQYQKKCIQRDSSQVFYENGNDENDFERNPNVLECTKDMEEYQEDKQPYITIDPSKRYESNQKRKRDSSLEQQLISEMRELELNEAKKCRRTDLNYTQGQLRRCQPPRIPSRKNRIPLRQTPGSARQYQRLGMDPYRNDDKRQYLRSYQYGKPCYPSAKAYRESSENYPACRKPNLAAKYSRTPQRSAFGVGRYGKDISQERNGSVTYQGYLSGTEQYQNDCCKKPCLKPRLQRYNEYQKPVRKPCLSEKHLKMSRRDSSMPEQYQNYGRKPVESTKTYKREGSRVEYKPTGKDMVKKSQKETSSLNRREKFVREIFPERSKTAQGESTWIEQYPNDSSRTSRGESTDEYQKSCREILNAQQKTHKQTVERNKDFDKSPCPMDSSKTSQRESSGTDEYQEGFGTEPHLQAQYSKSDIEQYQEDFGNPEPSQISQNFKGKYSKAGFSENKKGICSDHLNSKIDDFDDEYDYARKPKKAGLNNPQRKTHKQSKVRVTKWKNIGTDHSVVNSVKPYRKKESDVRSRNRYGQPSANRKNVRSNQPIKTTQQRPKGASNINNYAKSQVRRCSNVEFDQSQYAPSERKKLSRKGPAGRPPYTNCKKNVRVLGIEPQNIATTRKIGSLKKKRPFANSRMNELETCKQKTLGNMEYIESEILLNLRTKRGNVNMKKCKSYFPLINEEKTNSVNNNIYLASKIRRAKNLKSSKNPIEPQVPKLFDSYSDSYISCDSFLHGDEGYSSAAFVSQNQDFSCQKCKPEPCKCFSNSVADIPDALLYRTEAEHLTNESIKNKYNGQNLDDDGLSECGTERTVISEQDIGSEEYIPHLDNGPSESYSDISQSVANRTSDEENEVKDACVKCPEQDDFAEDCKHGVFNSMVAEIALAEEGPSPQDVEQVIKCLTDRFENPHSQSESQTQSRSGFISDSAQEVLTNLMPKKEGDSQNRSLLLQKNVKSALTQCNQLLTSSKIAVASATAQAKTSKTNVSQYFPILVTAELMLKDLGHESDAGGNFPEATSIMLKETLQWAVERCKAGDGSCSFQKMTDQLINLEKTLETTKKLKE